MDDAEYLARRWVEEQDGDGDGSRLNEKSPPRPTTARGAWRASRREEAPHGASERTETLA